MNDDNSNIGKWTAGILAAVISGVIVYHLTEGQNPPPLPPSPPPTNEPFQSASPSPIPEVEFMIINNLGETQVSEEVQVYLEEQLVATLMVDQRKPKSKAKIKVRNHGNYTYKIFADGIFLNQFGQPYRAQGHGEGNIEVNIGSVFMVTLTPHGIRLVPES